MKKYILFVFALFIILLGFNTNVTSASNCAPGDLFHTATGQPCSTTTLPAGCNVGDLFSSLTGKSCGSTTPSPAFFCREFIIGTKGEAVRMFQRELNAQGANLIVDGSYGPLTHSAFGIYCERYPNPSSVVISGVSGPQTLNINETGTWIVNASDPGNGVLSYSVNWNNEPGTTSIAFNTANSQSATFTHSYSQAGTYRPTFIVTNSSGQTARTSLTVNVVEDIPVVINPKINITTVSSGVLCRPTGQEYSATVTCPTNTTLVDCGLDETGGQPWSHVDSSFYANYPAGSGGDAAYWVSRAKNGGNSCQFRIKTNQEGLCSASGTYWNLRAFCTPDIKKETVTTTSTGVTCTANGQEYSNTLTCPAGTEVIDCGIDETAGQPWTHTDSAFFADLNSGQQNAYWTSRAKDGSNSCQFRIRSNNEALCPAGQYHWNLRAFCAPIKTIETVSEDISCEADGNEHTGTVSCPAGSTLISCGLDETAGQPWSHIDSAFFSDLGGSGQSTGYWVSRAKNGGNSCQFRIFTSESKFCTSPWKLRAFCSKGVNTNVLGAESFKFTKFLEEGLHGNEVIELQKFLNGVGYNIGNIDGFFGIKVKEALIKFQIANKLKSDGIVGYEVRTFLNK